MTRKYIPVLLTAILFTGCMSDKEYQLRKSQLENQKAHPATYDLFAVEGPVKVEILEGGKARVTVPGQPFREIPIPDGAAKQAELGRYLLNAGVLGALGWKALDGANGASTTTTNNNGAAQ